MKLATTAANSWFVNHKAVKNICFYRGTTIVAQAQYGWLAAQLKHGFRHDIKAIDEITEIRNCRKNNFKKNDVFFNTNELCLYIPADLLSVTAEEERVANRIESSGEIYYGTFFDLTYTENGDKRTVSVMHPTYDRKVFTARGQDIENLYQALRQLDDRVSRSTAEGMLNNRESFIELLKGKA